MLMRSVSASGCQPNAWPGRRSRFFWRELDDGLIVVDLDAFEFTLLNATAALPRHQSPIALSPNVNWKPLLGTPASSGRATWISSARPSACRFLCEPGCEGSDVSVLSLIHISEPTRLC